MSDKKYIALLTGIVIVIRFIFFAPFNRFSNGGGLVHKPIYDGSGFFNPTVFLIETVVTILAGIIIYYSAFDYDK